MSNTNTGGPAFPSPVIDVNGHEGMTLRDYFAAHADVSLYTPLENLTAQLHRKPTIGVPRHCQGPATARTHGG